MTDSDPEDTAGPAAKRRSGSAKRARGEIMALRVTWAERAELQASAAAAGLELGAYVRARALAPPDAEGGNGPGQRPSIVPYRVTAAERMQIEEAASRASLSPGSYVRALALKKPITLSRKKPPIEREALAQLLAQLGRLGSNMNQIARSINYRQHPDLYDLRETPAIIEETCDTIMEALGRTAAKKRRGKSVEAAET